MSLAFFKQLIVPKQEEQGLLYGHLRSYGSLVDDRSGLSGCLLKMEMSIAKVETDDASLESRFKTSVTSGDVESQKDCEYNQESYGNGRWQLNPRMISDAIIGLSDGLTVPFALTAGLSSLDDTHIVVLGGLAELVAGAISMGLGGFIGAKSEA